MAYKQQFCEYRAIKASRKARACVWCGEFIFNGEPARRYCGVGEGDFAMEFYHPECSDAWDRSRAAFPDDDTFEPRMETRGIAWGEEGRGQ